MKRRHSRTLGFDTLERLEFLSAMHPAAGFVAHAVHKPPRLPPFVRAVERAAHRMGSHVTVTPVVVAPGSLAEYQITFQFRGKTYTTQITIKAPVTPGPQPG